MKKPSPSRKSPAAPALIENKIHLIRGQKVMLDFELAALYEVPTKRFNEALKRNRSRFPQDFAFLLTNQEFSILRSQFATSRWGGRRYPPHAFTEHGVAMLSSILQSERAVQLNIMIIRTFVRLREIIAANKDLAARMDKLETGHAEHASIISLLAREIRALKMPPDPPPRHPIGFAPGLPPLAGAGEVLIQIN
jgi:ORF6N domain